MTQFHQMLKNCSTKIKVKFLRYEQSSQCKSMRDSSVSYASAAAKVDAWIFSVAISPINRLRNLILFKLAVTFNLNVYMFIAKNGSFCQSISSIFCFTWCIELNVILIFFQFSRWDIIYWAQTDDGAHVMCDLLWLQDDIVSEPPTTGNHGGGSVGLRWWGRQ